MTDLALDAQKNLFVLGNIAPALGVPANDFPTVNPIQATHGGGFQDGFLSVVNSTGSGLLFSTYLGGNGKDVFQSLGIDSLNRQAYASYFTDSTHFALTALQAGTGHRKGRMKLDFGSFLVNILKVIEKVITCRLLTRDT